eukprot:scaffold2755_cov194-Ochromonas_danica.AAC.1
MYCRGGPAGISRSIEIWVENAETRDETTVIVKSFPMGPYCAVVQNVHFGLVSGEKRDETIPTPGPVPYM